MNDLSAIIKWMQACIRAHNPRDIERWTIDELRGAFHTLPAGSFADFPTWNQLMNGQPAAAAPSAPLSPQPSQDEIDAVNDRAIAALSALHPDLRDRLDDEDAAQKVSAA